MSARLDDELCITEQEETVEAYHEGAPEGSQPVSEAQGKDHKPHQGHSKHEHHSAQDVKVNLCGEGVEGHGSSDSSCSNGCLVDGTFIFPGVLEMSIFDNNSTSPVNALLSGKEAETESEEEEEEVVKGDLSADTLAAVNRYLTENSHEASGDAKCPTV